MSAETNPISPERFAEALESLPLDALHAKVAEIRNSILHLKSSNEQMMPFAEEGDQDCKEAMFENLTVIGRMNERIEMIRREVENRGMMWGDAEDELAAERLKNGNGLVNGDAPAQNNTSNGANHPSGRLTDDELRRRLEARMAEDGDNDDDGVHL